MVWGRETASSARTSAAGLPGPQTPARPPIRRRSRSPLASAGASSSEAPRAGGQTPAAGGQTPAAGSALSWVTDPVGTLARAEAKSKSAPKTRKVAEGVQQRSAMFDWDELEAAAGGQTSAAGGQTTEAGGQTPGAGGETPARRFRVPHVASHGPPAPRPPGMPPMMPPAGVAVRSWDRWTEVEKRYQPHPCLPP